METSIETFLEKYEMFERAGYTEQADVLCKKLLEAFPDERNTILLRAAEVRLNNGRLRDGLIDLIRIYEEGADPDVYDTILYLFYFPNREERMEKYHGNLELLEKYPHYRKEENIADLQYGLLWQDEDILIGADLEKREIKAYVRKRIKSAEELKPDHIALIVNELWMEDLLICEEKCRISASFMDADIPMYIAYDKEFWQLFLQECDVRCLAETGRVVFLAGENACRDYFREDMVSLPKTVLFNGTEERYGKMLVQERFFRQEEIERYKEEVDSYYKDHAKDVMDGIKSGTPRILFLTSRYTTVLQYHTRDCMKAAERLGCGTALLIEPDNLHDLSYTYILKMILKFKPDILLSLDHFRFEYNRIEIPKELVWVCWVQDPMAHIMDVNTPLKLGARDIVMNHYTTWKKFHEIGYNPKCLIDAPVPADACTYRKYEITPEEKEKYECDICFLCHITGVEKHLEAFLKRIPVEIREQVRQIYIGYQCYVYESGQSFFTEEEFRLYTEGAMAQHFGLRLSPSLLNLIAEDMYIDFGSQVYRQALVDWLIDAGYRNMKLWGNGWADNPRYAGFAMGPAKNGETLSKIYQCSKIVVGNNKQTTGAARAWESMLSGAFYMSNFIPPEADAVDIRKVMEPEKELVMFYDRDDLLRKVNYYLTHEEERRRMAETGHDIALEKMTFDGLMERVIREIPERVAELEEEQI